MEYIKWIIHKVDLHHNFLTLMFAIIAGVYALIQYVKNSDEKNKDRIFQRITNLQNLWKTFYNDSEFMELFNVLDKLENNQTGTDNLRLIDQKIKLRFLAYLSEVYYFSEVANIDKAKALNLFQWHFYYTFINPKTKYLFWENLVVSNGGNIQDAIDTEIQKSYWNKYFLFAKEAEQKMISEGSV